MENYIIPDNLSPENFKKLSDAFGLYQDFKTIDLRKNLNKIALEVGCKIKEEEKRENTFISSGILDNSWFGKKKDENTIIVKDLGEIIIPERNTKEEIEKIIEFYRYDIDILYELLDFKEKYI